MLTGHIHGCANFPKLRSVHLSTRTAHVSFEHNVKCVTTTGCVGVLELKRTEVIKAANKDEDHK